MNYVLLGILVIFIFTALGVMLYFLLRPQSKITNGDFGSEDPEYNPNAFPSNWKSPINYKCTINTDCATGLVCDPFTRLCKLPDGANCVSQSTCLSTSFCNVRCYPNTTPVAYNSCNDETCDNVIGMMAPCPNPYQSVLSIDNNGQYVFICLKYGGASCSLDTDCASKLCSNKKCAFGYPLGHVCYTSNDCASNYCLNKSCQKEGTIQSSDDTGLSCGYTEEYYSCSKGTKCVNSICTSENSGLGMNCTSYSVPNTLSCYKFSDTTKNGEVCIGCEATFCTDVDTDCNASFPVNNPNSLPVNKKCTQGMIASGSLCIPGKDMPSSGICASPYKITTGKRLYYLRPVSKTYPSTGIIGLSDMSYIPVNFANINLENITNYEIAIYGYNVDGTPTSNPNWIYLLISNNTLFYSVANPNETNITVRTFGIVQGLSVTYSLGNDGTYNPHIYVLMANGSFTDIYEIVKNENSLVLDQKVYSANDTYTYLSAFYSYDENGTKSAQKLNFYLSNTAFAILITNGVQKSLSFKGEASLCDFNGDTYVLGVSYISNGIWSVYNTIDNSLLVSYPSLGNITSSFSIQNSSVTAFPYNNMVSVTFVDTSYNLYYYSSGSANLIPGYFTNKSIVRINPISMFILTDTYCT